MSDEYTQVARGKLKLKTDGEQSSKKHKKCKKKSKDIEKAIKTNEISSDTVQIKERDESKFTKAELSFKKMQEKMQHKRVIEKASTTHKQQVEKFNDKLDQLTEHFDIPKVSWTK